MAKLKRIILRSTRGTVLIEEFDLNLPLTEKIIGDEYDMNKKAFILTYQHGDFISEKINKITGSFEGEFFNIEQEELMDLNNKLILEKEETRRIIVQTKQYFREFLITADKRGDADVSAFQMYKLFIEREKAIYSTLNMFKKTDSSSLIVQGLAWCPTSCNLSDKLAMIRQENNFSGLVFEKLDIEGVNITRPTAFQTNDFM